MKKCEEIWTLNFRVNLISTKIHFESEGNMMKMGFKKEYLKGIHRIVCYVSRGFTSVLDVYIQFTDPKFCIHDKYKICAANGERKKSSV